MEATPVESPVPPPYTAVIFTSQRTATDDDGYAAMGLRMQTLAAEQPGFLGVESVRDPHGLGITVSYWTTPDTATAWRANLEHQAAQDAGRSTWYRAYQLRIATVDRVTSFQDGVRVTTGDDGFAGLVASRKGWIERQLKPWCRRAKRTDLLLAEHEWSDIAGKVDPEKTLWAWAWSRFPELVHDELGLDESQPVVVTLTDGRCIEGYPDARHSRRGELWLIGHDEAGRLAEHGPYLIDAIFSVRRVSIPE
jgi:heme-degrading monooxygenase HmoA